MSRARRLLEEDVTSIPTLIQRKAHAADALRFRDQVRDLPRWETKDLLPRLGTTNDPLVLWALHLEFTTRGIQPSLRIPSHQLGPQGDYIDLAADVLWLMRKFPTHKAAFRGWQTTLRMPCGSREWHEHLYRQFLFTYPRGMAHLTSKGLALRPEQRQQLLSVPTARMAKARRELEGAQFSLLLDELTQYSARHPDKSRVRSAAEIATRRAYLYRVHVLAGNSITQTTKCWQLLMDEHVSRQAISEQIKAVEKALKEGQQRAARPLLKRV